MLGSVSVPAGAASTERHTGLCRSCLRSPFNSKRVSISDPIFFVFRYSQNAAVQPGPASRPREPLALSEGGMTAHGVICSGGWADPASGPAGGAGRRASPWPVRADGIWTTATTFRLYN